VDQNSPASPFFLDHNDVYNPVSPGASPYAHLCANQTGTNGNFSQPPNLVSSNPSVNSDFELEIGSAAGDAGNNAAFYTDTDFLGAPRVQDGYGTGKAIVDMGALERVGIPGTVTAAADVGKPGNLALTPSSLSPSAGGNGNSSVLVSSANGLSKSHVLRKWIDHVQRSQPNPPGVE